MSKVMVVDDEPAILDILVTVLEDEGYDVVTADNGLQAVDLFMTEQPDLVLLDIMMPGIDGREVYRRLRDRKALNGSRVVMLSAGVQPNPAEYPVAAFLPKPFDLDQLLDTVSRLLDK